MPNIRPLLAAQMLACQRLASLRPARTKVFRRELWLYFCRGHLSSSDARRVAATKAVTAGKVHPIAIPGCRSPPFLAPSDRTFCAGLAGRYSETSDKVRVIATPRCGNAATLGGP